MTGSRLTIFSIMFGVFYIAAFYYDLALFRYYPEVGQFHLLRNDNLGVVILWYGWIATSALASAAIGLGLLPMYWQFWRKRNGPETAPARRYLTWLLAFFVWWNFIVGHVLNDIRGLLP